MMIKFLCAGLGRLFSFLGRAFLLVAERLKACSCSGDVIKREGKWLTVRVQGAMWRLNQERYIDAELLKNGVFEPPLTQWVNKFAKKGMVAADVGANFGYYTVQLSRLVGSEGHVYAFEPVDIYYERLVEHLQMNGCGNVSVARLGLSNEAGRKEIDIGPDSASLHPVHLPGQDPGVKQEIDLVPLDKFVADNQVKRLDFIKVDIDGNEPRFIEGAIGTIKSFRPVIFMEFSQHHFLKAGSSVDLLADRLKDLGYFLYSEKTGKLLSTTDEFRVEAMNCAFSTNILCMPSFVSDDLRNMA